MPSLKEQLAAQKAEIAMTREQEAETERQRLLAEAKGKYDSLLQEKQKIQDLREALTGARTQLTEARQALRTERGNLRELHEESKDEATGEALLPKPQELVSSEDYKDADEIQAYEGAKRQFAQEAENIKEVEERLRAVGIEDPRELGVAAVQSLLEKREQELAGEAKEMLLKQPELDPESAQEAREEAVAAKANAFDIGRSGATRKFFDAVAYQERPEIKAAVGKALDGVLSDQRQLLRRLEEVLGNDPDKVGEVDEEALVRALAAQMATDDPSYGAMYENLGRSYDMDVNTTGKGPIMEKVQAEIIADGRVQEAARELLVLHKLRAEYVSLGAEDREAGRELTSIERRQSEIRGEISQAEWEIKVANSHTEESKRGAEDALAFISKDKPEIERDAAEVLDEMVLLPQGQQALYYQRARNELRPLYGKQTECDEALRSRERELEKLKKEKPGVFGGGKHRAAIAEKEAQIETLTTRRRELAAEVQEIEEKRDKVRNVEEKTRRFLGSLDGFTGGSVRQLLEILSQKALKLSVSWRERAAESEGRANEHTARRESLLAENDGLRERQEELTARQSQISARMRDIREKAGDSIELPRY
jgi:hypothetical protein